VENMQQKLMEQLIDIATIKHFKKDEYVFYE
jgi:hypothetical protein